MSSEKIISNSKSKFVESNGIRLHYLEHNGDGELLILMHGLTANAHAFDGLIDAGLAPAYHIISIDLRGRGESDSPDAGYTMMDHANDIIGLLDQLNITQAIIGGHSFGGLLALFLAIHFPERVEKLILLDAAARMHENTKEMLGPSLSRLGQIYPSLDHYINKVKAAPYLDFWNEHMFSYYDADVERNENDNVRCIPQLANMVFAVNGVLAEPWEEYLKDVKQPALLINGPGIYTMGAALLPKENALETVEMMKNCAYAEVPGNHQTMLYGDGAEAMVKAIKDFIK